MILLCLHHCYKINPYEVLQYNATKDLFKNSDMQMMCLFNCETRSSSARVFKFVGYSINCGSEFELSPIFGVLCFKILTENVQSRSSAVLDDGHRCHFHVYWQVTLPYYRKTIRITVFLLFSHFVLIQGTPPSSNMTCLINDVFSKSDIDLKMASSKWS